MAKKKKSPIFHSRKRGTAIRSFMVTLLGSAAIAVLAAGIWQLLDPVDYQPPLTPITAETLAAAAQAEEPPEGEPPGGGEDYDVVFNPPEGSGGDSGSGGYVQVAEGEWLGSDYFDDALFVGDSITEGIKLYDVMNNATILASTGVNLNTLYTKAAITLDDGSKVPILDATAAAVEGHPGKIYLMMGVNSLLSDEDTFRTDYGRVVDTLISQHPEAILYIQSILPVTAAYEQKPEAVTDNAKIDRYNEVLKELAAEKGVYYLNVAEVFKDENGCLPASASPNDGIHFGSSWYRTWFDYLRTHGAQ